MSRRKSKSRLMKKGISRRSSQKVTRRQALGTMAKFGGAALAGLAVGGVVGHPAKPRTAAAATEETGTPRAVLPSERSIRMMPSDPIMRTVPLVPC